MSAFITIRMNIELNERRERGKIPGAGFRVIFVACSNKFVSEDVRNVVEIIWVLGASNAQRLKERNKVKSCRLLCVAQQRSHRRRKSQTRRYALCPMVMNRYIVRLGRERMTKLAIMIVWRSETRVSQCLQHSKIQKQS